MQFRQKTDEVLLAGLQKPSPELYNSRISSRIQSSAVRVLTSGPHPTSQRCHVKIFDFAMAVPAKPGPASLKACRLARPPSPRGKAFCCLTTRGLSGYCASSSAAMLPHVSGEVPAGRKVTLPLAKLSALCADGMARIKDSSHATPEGDRAPRPCHAYIAAASAGKQERGALPSRGCAARHLPIHMGRLGSTARPSRQMAVC